MGALSRMTLTLAAPLPAARKAAGFTQVNLSERLVVGQSYVSKIERGEAYVDALMLQDWCALCGVKPGALLDKIGRACPSAT